MSSTRELHREAMVNMRIAKEALAEQDRERYLAHLHVAFALEQNAANNLLTSYESEPTRSVLYRSSATMAFELGAYKDAQKLIYKALSGNAPSEIEQELLILQERIEVALLQNVSARDQVDYSYLNVIKEKAVNLKVEPKTDKYSKAVVIEYVVNFLSNVQSSYKNYAEVNIRKHFARLGQQIEEATISHFRKESNLLAVDLNFQSFGIGLVADPLIMVNQELYDSTVIDLKKSIFENFKREVIYADFNDNAFHNLISEKYDEGERSKIYTSITKSLDSKSEYKVAICDAHFKAIVKKLPTLSKVSQAILKPKASEELAEKQMVIKRTLELHDNVSNRGTKLQTDFLSYAEFDVQLRNVSRRGLPINLFFSDPYSIKIVFQDNRFIIEDSFFEIYIEDDDYKKIQALYEEALVNKYMTLTQVEEKTVDNEMILDRMKYTFIVSSSSTEGDVL